MRDDVRLLLRSPYVLVAAAILLTGWFAGATFNAVPTLLLFLLVVTIVTSSNREARVLGAKMDALINHLKR